MLSLVYRSPIRRTLLISAVRYNSSVPVKTRFRFGGSHFFIGFTGVVIGVGSAGYAWYYFSGLRKIINRIQDAIVFLDQARDNLSKHKPPSEVLWFLRRAVKSYVAFPGSNFVVDQIFDAVDDKVDAHADEANALIATASTQIRDIIQQDGDKSVMQHSAKILGVLRNLMKQLQPKSLELKEMAEKYEVRKKVDDGWVAATAGLDVTKEKAHDLKSQLQQKNPFRRKPVNDDPPQPAADTDDR